MKPIIQCHSQVKATLSNRMVKISVASLVLVGWMLPGVFGHSGTHRQLERVNQQLLVEPENPHLYIKRAELHRMHGMLEEAEADCHQALQLGSELAEINLCRARIRVDQEQPGEALVILNRLLDKQPKVIPGYLRRAEAYMLLGRPLEAGEDYDRAIELFAAPHHARPDHYMARAKAYAAAGETDRALAGLDQGIKQMNGVISLQEYAVQLVREAGRFPEALQRIGAILEGLPGSAPWLIQRGDIHAAMGDSAEAERSYILANEQFMKIPSGRRGQPALVALNQCIQQRLALYPSSP